MVTAGDTTVRPSDTEERGRTALVIGVGGCGGNIASALSVSAASVLAVAALNTDRQALERTDASDRLLLGERALRGRGAGADIAMGAQAAEDARDEIAALIGDAEVVFVVAGLGGGTGSGAAPVVCRVARELGVLAIAIVARPFAFEGPFRRTVAFDGETRLEREADALIAFENDQLLRLGSHIRSAEAFGMINAQIGELVQATCSMLTGAGVVNLDIADLRRVTSRSGSALIRTGYGGSAMEATMQALNGGSNGAAGWIGGTAAPPAGAATAGTLTGALALERVLVHFTAFPLPTLMDMQQAIAEITEATGAADVFWGLSEAGEGADDGVAVLLLGAGAQYDGDVMERHLAPDEDDEPDPPEDPPEEQDEEQDDEEDEPEPPEEQDEPETEEPPQESQDLPEPAEEPARDAREPERVIASLADLPPEEQDEPETEEPPQESQDLPQPAEEPERDARKPERVIASLADLPPDREIIYVQMPTASAPEPEPEPEEAPYVPPANSYVAEVGAAVDYDELGVERVGIRRIRDYLKDRATRRTPDSTSDEGSRAG